MNTFFFHLIASLTLTCLATILLGIFVFVSKRNNPVSKVFLLYSLSISWWSFLQILHMTSPDRVTALWVARIMEAGVFFIPTLYIHFLCLFLELRNSDWILRSLYGISVALGTLCITPYMVADAVSYRFNIPYMMTPGPLYPIAVVFFIACTLYGTYELYKAYSRASGLRRTQLAYLLWASVLGYIGGSANFLLVFDIPLLPLTPFGTYAVPLYVAATAYAIGRYRLMDISVVIHKGIAYGFLLATILIPIYLTVAATQRATFYSIPPLLAGTLILACGLWVLMKQPRAVPNVTFAFLCAGASVWLFGFFLVYSSAHEADALLWGKGLYLGIVYIPALFYHFCASLLHHRATKKLITINYLVSTVFLLLIPTPYLISGQHSYFWGHYPKAGVLHPVFLAYFTGLSGLSLYYLHQGEQVLRQSNPLEATRLRYVFWAFVIGFGASLDFTQTYGHEFYPIGYLAVSACILIVTYAIVKYRLMDTALIPAKPTFPSYLQALSLIPFYLLILFLIRLFTGSTQYLLAGILLTAFLVFAEGLANLHGRIEQAIERFLFRQRHDAYETLIEFSRAMVTILDLSALNSTIMDTLCRVLGIEKASVFLFDKEKAQYYLATAHGLDFDEMKALRLSTNHALPQCLSQIRSIVVLEELQDVAERETPRTAIETLRQLNADVCMPLINKDRLIGFINLGPRIRHQIYSEDELNLLTTLSQNAAVALDNAMLYEDLRRTQILMRRTDRLRSLETIAGGFAHEIRNPLTSIKTFVQLAPERKHDEEFIGQFGHVVLDDVYRIERLIQEILDYARYMEPKFAEEDLNDIVTSCLYFVDVKAESKGITIEKRLARNLPHVMLDRQQLKQVLLNLLLNAMEAMGDLGGRLIVNTRQLAKPGDGWIQIEVRDTGPGIAPADLDHIFDPFYTTKHQSDEREGTGLGLTIVHQIVREHHGYIEVESQLGSGTTFFINLPVSQPHVALAK